MTPSTTIEISEEAKKAAAIMSAHFAHLPTAWSPDFWERTIQEAINSSREQDKKRIEELEREIKIRDEYSIQGALTVRDKIIEEKNSRIAWLEARYRGTEKTTFQFYDKTSIEVDCFWENGEQILTAYALSQIEEHKYRKKIALLEQQILKLRELLKRVDSYFGYCSHPIAKEVHETLTDAQRELENSK